MAGLTWTSSLPCLKPTTHDVAARSDWVELIDIVADCTDTARYSMMEDWHGIVHRHLAVLDLQPSKLPGFEDMADDVLRHFLALHAR